MSKALVQKTWKKLRRGARSAALAVALLGTAGPGVAQGLKCEDVDRLKATADLSSLATSSFKQINKSTKKAPARSLLPGYQGCEVGLMKGQYGSGYFYSCKVPGSLKKHKDVKAAVAAFGALLRPCLPGWKEEQQHNMAIYSYFFTKEGQRLGIDIHPVDDDDDEIEGEVEVPELMLDRSRKR